MVLYVQCSFMEAGVNWRRHNLIGIISFADVFKYIISVEYSPFVDVTFEAADIIERAKKNENVLANVGNFGATVAELGGKKYFKSASSKINF